MDTEHCYVLSTQTLRQLGLLQPETFQTVRLTWPHTRRMPAESVELSVGPIDHLDVEYRGSRQTVPLMTTVQHYGGVRWWFGCPDCGRRCADLYLSEDRFSCRVCHRLTYAIWNENETRRITRRAWKVQQQLGTPGDGFRSCWMIPDRPKGMHQKTYVRHVQRIHELAAEVIGDSQSLLSMVRGESARSV